jgi:hypothetical protein
VKNLPDPNSTISKLYARCKAKRLEVERRLARSSDGDNQGEVRKHQDASASELPPSPITGVAMKDGSKTSDDENEMPDASDEYHQRVWPLYLASSEKRPQLTQASLHQVSHEQAEGVPEYCNCDSSTVPPRTVAPRQNDDRNVNQCLKQMKRPQRGNDKRGSRQGYQDEPSSDPNPRKGYGRSARCHRRHWFWYDTSDEKFRKSDLPM